MERTIVPSIGRVDIFTVGSNRSAGRANLIPVLVTDVIVRALPASVVTISAIAAILSAAASAPPAILAISALVAGIATAAAVVSASIVTATAAATVTATEFATRWWLTILSSNRIWHRCYNQL
jgi:hypothetical protein